MTRQPQSFAVFLRPASRVAVIVLAFGLGHFSTLGQDIKPLPPAEPVLQAAARTIGIRRCLNAVSAVAQRASLGATQQDLLVDWDRAAPDAGPFFALTALGDGTRRAALSVSAVPAPDGGCAIKVERISAASQSCAQLAEAELADHASVPLIEGVRVYQNQRVPGETYMLVANSPGCLVIRRQVAMKWPPRQ